jgi:hypothetical protein
MFDEEDYVSDEEEPRIHSSKNVAPQALVPSSGSSFNQLYGEGESLIKMMKERGCNSRHMQWISPIMRSKK